MSKISETSSTRNRKAPVIGHMTIGGRPICTIPERDMEILGKASWQCEYDSFAKAAKAIARMNSRLRHPAPFEYVIGCCPRHKHFEVAGPHAVCSAHEIAAWVKKGGKKVRGTVGWHVARDMGVI